MQILITGSSGFIADHLIKELLNDQQYQIIAVTRNPISLSKEYGSKITPITINDVHLYQPDIIINLAGAGILDQPWTSKRIQELYDSRVIFTEKLIHQIENHSKKPQLWIQASAIGYYGANHSKNLLNEEDIPVDDGPSKLVQEWELAASKNPSFRTVFLRFGVVLGKNGGFLKKILPLFKLGLGARFGSGNQAFPWISIQDIIGFIKYSIKNIHVNGHYNLTTSDLKTQNEFNIILAKKLERPYWLFLPEFLLKIIFQEGSALILKGKNMDNKKLKLSGYELKYDNLENAFDEIL